MQNTPAKCAKDRCRVEPGCPGSVLDRDPVPRTELRVRRTHVRGRRTQVRGRRTQVRGRRSQVRVPRTPVRSQTGPGRPGCRPTGSSAGPTDPIAGPMDRSAVQNRSKCGPKSTQVRSQTDPSLVPNLFPWTGLGSHLVGLGPTQVRFWDPFGAVGVPIRAKTFPWGVSGGRCAPNSARCTPR